MCVKPIYIHVYEMRNFHHIDGGFRTIQAKLAAQQIDTISMMYVHETNVSNS